MIISRNFRPFVIFAFVLIAVMWLLVSTLHAGVSIRNGNFFVGYKDLIYPGGLDMSYERVCNSKTPYRGINGHCWGTPAETSARALADGSVRVSEFGGGAENLFFPVGYKAEDVQKGVDLIFAAVKKEGSLTTPEQSKRYLDRLKNDAGFRGDEWARLLRARKVKAVELPVGAQLTSNRFSYQYLTRVADGYVRTSDNGKTERFNNEGRLVRVADKHGNFIAYTYNRGQLAKAEDNFNRKMFFSYNKQGLLDKVQGEDGKVATYQYNDKGELIQSKDAEANVYTYQYDSYHNLKQIGYADKTTQNIEYYGVDKKMNVKSVKDRDGTLTSYTYENGAEGAGHLKIGVLIKDKSGAKISDNKYEYFTKKKVTGEEWTHKMVASLDGDRTETVYNECCGLPLMIKRGKDETTFQYDAKGHVTKKVTPSEVTQLAYDNKIGKVIKVTKYSKADPKKVQWSEFKYDDKANLTFAKNSENQSAYLFYDSVGRIASMVNKDSKIKLTYDENSRPVKIEDPAVGSIAITYSKSGEVKSTESTEKGIKGRKIAAQVGTAFRSLLEIIKPAGVSLTQ